MEYNLTELECEMIQFLRDNFDARNTIDNLINGGIALNWGVADVIGQVNNSIEWKESRIIECEKAIDNPPPDVEGFIERKEAEIKDLTIDINALKRITDDDASTILEDIDRNHDACYGVSWDSLDFYIDEFIRYNK